jgi:hypothetical protein
VEANKVNTVSLVAHRSVNNSHNTPLSSLSVQSIAVVDLSFDTYRCYEEVEENEARPPKSQCS